MNKIDDKDISFSVYPNGYNRYTFYEDLNLHDKNALLVIESDGSAKSNPIGRSGCGIVFRQNNIIIQERTFPT